jgi:hypothetical protein
MTPLTFLELTDALIHDQAAKAAFAADPPRYLGEHGLAGFSPQEVATAIEHAADALPAPVAARLTPEPPPGLDGMDAVSHQLAQVAAIDPLEAEATWIDHGEPDVSEAGVGDPDPGDLDPGDLDLRRPDEVDGLGETHEVDGLGEDHDTLVDATPGVHLDALDELGRSPDLEFGRGTEGGATAPIGGGAGLDGTTSEPTPVEPTPSEPIPTSDELEDIAPVGDDPGLFAALDETDDPADEPADGFDDE